MCKCKLQKKMRIISKINQNLEINRFELSKHIIKVEMLDNNDIQCPSCDNLIKVSLF